MPISSAERFSCLKIPECFLDFLCRCCAAFVNNLAQVYCSRQSRRSARGPFSDVLARITSVGSLPSSVSRQLVSAAISSCRLLFCRTLQCTAWQAHAPMYMWVIERAAALERFRDQQTITQQLRWSFFPCYQRLSWKLSMHTPSLKKKPYICHF